MRPPALFTRFINHQRGYYFTSLRRQLIAAFAFAILPPLVVLTSLLVFIVNRSADTAWERQHREATMRARDLLGSYLEGQRMAFRLLDFVGVDEVARKAGFLEDFILLNPDFDEVVLVSSDGRIINNAPRQHPTLASQFTIQQSIWYQETLRGQPYLGDLQVSHLGEPYLILAQRTRDGGVLAGRLRMQLLWKTVRDLRFGDTGIVFVVDHSGRVIAHPDTAIVMNNLSIARLPTFINLQLSDRQVELGRYYNFYGEFVQSKGELIEGTAWWVVTELSVAEATAVTRNVLVTVVLGLVVTGVITTWLVVQMLTRQVFEPVRRLQAGAEALGAGRLAHRIGLKREDEIGQVGLAFDNMAARLQEREAALAASEERYRAIVQDQTEFIIRFDPAGRITFLNEAYCRYRGRPVSELTRERVARIVHPDHLPGLLQALRLLVPANPILYREFQASLSGGILRWQGWNVRAIYDAAGNLLEYQAVGRDITDRKHAEQTLLKWNETLEARVAQRTLELENEIEVRRSAESQLQISINEKDVLLKEIHHRVKNNLQVVSSLLSLQAGDLPGQAEQEAFLESQNRIRSMALIHEKLYRSSNLQRIAFGEYIHSLAGYLFSSYRCSDQVKMQIEADDVALSIEQAVPCGLILNELISNAFKHAFKDGRSGVMRVRLTNGGGQATLLVADDGPGLPEGFKPGASASLGLQLVESLVDQLDGTLLVSSEAGAKFILSFPLVQLNMQL